MPHALSHLAQVFEKDLDRILRLYAIDDTFAEICRDYMEVAQHRKTANEPLPLVEETLGGLEEEIRKRLDLEQDPFRSEITK